MNSVEEQFMNRLTDYLEGYPKGRADVLREAEAFGLTREEAERIVRVLEESGAVRFE